MMYVVITALLSTLLFQRTNALRVDIEHLERQVEGQVEGQVGDQMGDRVGDQAEDMIGDMVKEKYLDEIPDENERELVTESQEEDEILESKDLGMGQNDDVIKTRSGKKNKMSPRCVMDLNLNKFSVQDMVVVREMVKRCGSLVSLLPIP